MQRFLPSPLLANAFVLLLTAALFSACKKDPTPEKGQLALAFENVVGNQQLVLGSPTYYTTAAGDQFKVTKFNYFISNIKLTRNDGTEWAEPESYHLVKQAEPDSKAFTLQGIPAGDYTKMTFTIGVDSARNTSGAQTGALDQLNDMYWSWSSGYIFLKLEGNSPQAPNTGALQYHVGGFRKPNNTIRTVSPALPAGVTLQIRSEKTQTVHLKADVLKMFAGPNTIRFAQMPNTGHSSDPRSMLLADNYAAAMFRIDQIH
ncbi:MbnP family protein [Hymenobacter koreensis]|uniref:Copper-binding protein MbnP-like domain-containing protein n=1 Tax=Hymenobacter koreensis TaxID=1084523 RepID=A0ABP8IZB3_9BACT